MDPARAKLLNEEDIKALTIFEAIMIFWCECSPIDIVGNLFALILLGGWIYVGLFFLREI